MSVAIITGSAGLIGSEASSFFAGLGFDVFGIDNDMRSQFFGDAASTTWNRERLKAQLGASYRDHNFDIRNQDEVNRLFETCGGQISLVIHTAAQPSHDWAARAPLIDFSVNAQGTLNLLEATRRFCPRAAFIFTSTNKVYGDTPNRLPLIELDTRWEIDPTHMYWTGVDEGMSIDQTLHSIFGASKVTADVLVQEYGRYFGLHAVCFRGGCLTGPHHSGAQLHGFLAYLMRCTLARRPYTVFGYQGKQVRDNIHSADLIGCFYEFFKDPRCGEVYNIGGGRFSNASLIESIHLCEQISGKKLDYTYQPENRIGDHIWWITDSSKFSRHYPAWTQRYSMQLLLQEMFENNLDRCAVEAG
jgi:CDP-paratose 2-epimerase